MFVQIGIISINYQSIWLKFYKAGQNQNKNLKNTLWMSKKKLQRHFLMTHNFTEFDTSYPHGGF